MVEKLLAGVVVLVCAALLLRLALPPARRQRWDRFWRRRAEAVRALGRWAARQWRLARHSRAARRQADEAIRRARDPGRENGRENGRDADREADRDGNVIRPRKFGKRDSTRPPLH